MQARFQLQWLYPSEDGVGKELIIGSKHACAIPQDKVQSNKKLLQYFIVLQYDFVESALRYTARQKLNS